MNGLGLVLVRLPLSLWALVSANVAALDHDTVLMDTRNFVLPLNFDPDRVARLEKVRLFVSQDRGKTWQHEKDCGTQDDKIVFAAPKDGLYYFALQTVDKDGTKRPRETKKLTASMKVFVSEDGKALIIKPPEKDEVAELRKEVERLRKRINTLQSTRTRR